MKLMKDRLTELLDKYWEGETSLTEEAELKSLLKKTDSYPDLSGFFSGTEHLARLDIGNMRTVISRKTGYPLFLKIAAVFIGFFLIGSLIYYDYHQREQEKAYVQVMGAFSLIQSNMVKGSEELHVLDEFRHLSKTHELFKKNNINEQL